MEASQFFYTLRKYIGTDKTSIQDFMAYIFSLVIDFDENEEQLNEDLCHPFTKIQEKSAANKAFNGDRLIPIKIARFTFGHFNKTNLVDVVYTLPDDTKNNLCADFYNYGILCSISNIDEVVAELFKNILESVIADNIDEYDLSDDFTIEGVRKPSIPLESVRYHDHTVYLKNERIWLPIQLVPEDNLLDSDLPYFNALCEVYAEKLERIINKENIDTIDNKYKRHLRDQRKAYYAADSIQRSVREVFSDGERQFENIKEDAFEGIKNTYYSDRFLTGYDRLQAVLDRVSVIQLSKSALINIIGLIGNLERMGICHILVNDNVITSWVNNNE